MYDMIEGGFFSYFIISYVFKGEKENKNVKSNYTLVSKKWTKNCLSFSLWICKDRCPPTFLLL